MIEDIDRRAFLVKLLGIPAALMANDLHISLAKSTWKNEPAVRRLGAVLATL